MDLLEIVNHVGYDCCRYETTNHFNPDGGITKEQLKDDSLEQQRTAINTFLAQANEIDTLTADYTSELIEKRLEFVKQYNAQQVQKAKAENERRYRLDYIQ